MSRHRRKLLLETLLLGVALTLVVFVAEAAGLLRTLDNWFFDQRVARCQQFTAPPTTQLVHLDVDDRAIEVIGSWPWPRSKLALMFDELARAKPRAVATDIIFPEAQGVSYERRADGSIEGTDHDALFAASIGRLKGAILPAALFSGKAVTSPLAKAMFDELRGNLECEERELFDRLLAKKTIDARREREVADLFFPVRREVVFSLVYAMLSHPGSQPATRPADAVRALLKSSEADVDFSSPLTYIVAREFDRAAAMVALRRLAAPKPAGAPSIATASGSYYAPLLSFAKAASATGFVDFFSDGVVRNVPLLAEHDGRVYPQLGLALALKCLDADPAALRYSTDEVVIPLAGRNPIVIPVRTGTSGSKERGVPLLLDIPWFGSHDWETMYDHPSHKKRAQHVPLIKLWQIVQLERKLRKNSRECDDALLTILLFTHEDRAKAYEQNIPAVEDVGKRVSAVRQALGDPDVRDFQAQLLSTPPAQQDADSRKFLAAHRQLEQVLPQLPQLETELAAERRDVVREFAGKAVLVGWTATGVAADFVPTPLHDHCPGAVVHGAVFNAVMTGQFWRRAPGWLAVAVTFALGLLTASASVGLSALRALACALLLLAAYLFANGVIVFGYFHRLLPLAAPVLTIGFVWAMCTLYRVIVETREREHIKARFQTYADPMLVEHVLEHPEKVRFDGEVKDLTVVFTDLANFTPISEQLGERSVALLNEYLSAMVPIISARGGFVNKFFGDGIMFFFGAPVENPRHAPDAVASVLEMQAAMGPLNERMAEQGFPHLTVRAGVCTGAMVVGDAGTRGRSDYTVLGDAVNLGSRLEGANKALGTLVLVSARTEECSRDQFLFRPVGRVRVVGKHEAVEVFEPICPIEQATELTRKTAALTADVVDAYKARRLDACLAAIDVLELHTGGPGKLTAIYRELCVKSENESKEDWDGSIALSEK